ncbi:TonB-dependent receptor [Neptunitalea lumnitzerae]|uniref:TonB-dependent receptor n=1 Tax=Neptunitalea lumnitzerae TaxID=2965509 RepID=A0ABQ5MGG3_9FLAO|nr:TonB-dependent receptor [Neptunitalea sp. Y10]GLB48510.1 TonB-dependent receptor [Neptunitalea sp. Y10]
MRLTFMNFKITAFLVILTAFYSNAQEGSLYGNVKDENGEPLLGVNVTIENTNKGSSTDFDGNYKITDLENGETTVIVTYIGFVTQKKVVTVDGETALNFVLQEDATQLTDVVVTGVLNPKSKLQSSVSVSTVGPAKVNEAAPRVTAEVFRSVPGIKSESTGGEGNANITVRGIPVASGGGKFLQLHEDGLPVMQFGDVAFGNSDIFLRYDQTVARIEAIRGGSASTLASNSPAGIINFISKNGKVEGGSITHSLGVDYKNSRTDFEYGAPINETLNFHLGGFYRQGEGPRNTGYTANIGGQFKANLTKSFEKGYVRLYLKYLNDKAVGYLPMPVQVSGTNANPEWSSLSNFDILHDTPHSALFLDNLSVGADGQPRRSNIADGMRPVATSFGSEISFDLGSGWKLEERFRLNFNKGRFVSPFPADVQTAGNYATEFGVSNLTYANGVNAGENFDNNALAMRVHLFDVEINNFNNFTNDIKLSKSFGDIDVSAGYYRAIQNISMSWLWNSYLLEVQGENAALLNAGGASTNGLYAYGVPAWGNCCTRNYDAVYDISAPYVGAEYEVTDKLNIDASIRFDFGTARGTYAGAIQAQNLDVNNDGVIQTNEQSVSVVDNANRLPINYDFDYVSYSFGANYLLTDYQSVFARHSKGGRANADRLLFGSAVLPSGQAINGLSADKVTQTEVGFKHRKGDVTLYTTGFLANTSEQNWDFAGGSPREIQREYQAYGIELEAYYTRSKFDIGGSVTWTDAEIKEDFFNPDFEGNTPRRQADFIYNANVVYRLGEANKHALGFSVIGTTKSYAQDSNELVMPGYAYVNPFVRFQLIEGLTASVNVNNVFDTIGITEVEEGSITENTNNIVRARAINGRTTSLTLSYKF